MPLHPALVLALAALGSPAGFGAASPSGGCPPDAFEPNDTCASAATLAAGSHAALTVPDTAPDFYRVAVPEGHKLELVIHASDPAFGLATLFVDDGSVSPCDDPANRVAQALIESFGPDAVLGWSAPPDAPLDFLLSLEAFGDCLTYDLEVSIAPDPCAALAADALEPNDDCSGAAPLGTGFFGGLNVGVHARDYYALDAAPGELLTLRVDGLASGENATLFAWDAAASCGVDGQYVAAATIHGGFPSGFYLFNPTQAPRTYVVEVRPTPDQGAQTGFCVGYSLEVTSELDPCGVLLGDPFEPNSSCASAPLLASSQTGLSIHSWQDFDWYSIDVPAHSTLRLLSTSITPTTPRPMTLLAGCGPWNQEFLTASHDVYFSSLDPRQWLQWSNTGALDLNTRLFVHAPAGFPNAFCDVYDLDLEVTLGVPFCPLAQNSTGEAARLSAAGSTTVGVGTLELSATPLPAQKSGLVLFGPAQKAPSPFGQGYLCVQGPYVRLPVTTSGATGVLHTSVDWTGSSAAIVAGQSYWFQAWFRDPAGGGAGFNLSEGLRLDFE